MNKKKIFGLVLFFVGILIILNSALGITGDVISTDSFGKSINAILGLAFIVGGLVLFVGESGLERKIFFDVNKNRQSETPVRRETPVLVDAGALRYIHENRNLDPKMDERIRSFFSRYSSATPPKVTEEIKRKGSYGAPLVPKNTLGKFTQNGMRLYNDSQRMLEVTGYSYNEGYGNLILNEWQMTTKGSRENRARFENSGDLELLGIAYARLRDGKSTIIITTDTEIFQTSKRLNKLYSRTGAGISVKHPAFLVGKKYEFNE